MRQSVQLKHYEEYKKLTIYNLIVELDGLFDLEQSYLNKIILSDLVDRTCETSFLTYVQQKIKIAKVVLCQKEEEKIWIFWEPEKALLEK